MKKIILVLILLSSSVAYAGDPYVKTFYKGKNWTVEDYGITGEFKQCALKSSPFYADPEYPKFGYVYLLISYPSNNFTFCSENFGAYFTIAKKTRLQVDDGKSIVITPETPMPGKSIIDDMMKGVTAKVTVDFEVGAPDVFTFSLLGFTKAYNMLQACAAISSGPVKNDPPPQGSTEARQETATAQARGRKATQWAGVYVGMPADDVLKIHPKKETESESEVLGSDSEGLIVKWTYHGAYLILARREGKGTDSLGFSKCYRVAEIYLR
jgi:hypothetical protein